MSNKNIIKVGNYVVNSNENAKFSTKFLIAKPIKLY